MSFSCSGQMQDLKRDESWMQVQGYIYAVVNGFVSVPVEISDAVM